MWRPGSYSDISALCGSASESSSLDFKRELTSNTREIAKDIAAMTVDGGVLIYGVEEDTSTAVATAITKVPLSGAEERVRMIAQTNIRPVASFEAISLREHDGDADGVLVLVIAPSPLAPHEVDRRFPRRDGTTTAYMTEPEIDRLYQRRRQQTGRGIRANDLLDAAELLPGMDPTQARNTPGQHVAVVRVVCQPAGDAAHYGGASLEQPLANAVRRADAWMAPRSSWGRPALLSELDATGSKADGVEGWVSGMVHHDYPILLRGPTAAAVMRYPALLLSQVTVPLRRAGESDGFIDYSCAYEGLVVNEAVAALVLAGEWAADLQPAGIVHVVLQLAGFADAVPYYASKARAGMPVERMPRAPHGIVSSVNVPSLSLRQTPVDVARILLDRWLAAFYRGHDLYENIIGP